jgi:hypothetical protein
MSSFASYFGSSPWYILEDNSFALLAASTTPMTG